MASRPRVVMHIKGIRATFNDPAVTADLMRRAESIAREADALMPDSGYTETEHHRVRQGVTSIGTHSALVITNTNLAKAMQAKHSTLTRAMDAGRS